jgi:superfamily II DNA or RNA helicase
MKELDLKRSESRDVILATYSMAAEGMDIPVLNTLILASPIGDIEQAVGRIQRQKPNERKYVPYIIEMWDQYSLFQTQGLRHIKFYKKNGYSFVSDNPGAPGTPGAADMCDAGEEDDESDLDDDDPKTKNKKSQGKQKKEPVYDFIDDDT